MCHSTLQEVCSHHGANLIDPFFGFFIHSEPITEEVTFQSVCGFSVRKAFLIKQPLNC